MITCDSAVAKTRRDNLIYALAIAVPKEEVVFLLVVVRFHLSEHFINTGIVIDTFAEVERKYRLAGRARDHRVTGGLYLSIISPPVRKSNSESGAPDKFSSGRDAPGKLRLMH